ncbi:predicted protein [Botrytis cinerea T4]|uniref:Uncharacterized protein n=1 Tax=Botryotinia fuckeliana (strain T4) TaxID=999810 RepID=G2YAQ4_BOTF4|nr:predicted protein [Botrytis cinerea T4]
MTAILLPSSQDDTKIRVRPRGMLKSRGWGRILREALW